jgi:hypothetical protein
MKQRVWLIILAVAALALAGCGRTTSSLQAPVGGGAPAGSDEAQVSAIVESNPDVVDEDVWQSLNAQSYDNSVGMAAIRPLRFWRNITSVERSVDTQFGEPDGDGRPTRALVTVSKHLLGTFNILAGAAELTDTTRARLSKPINDQWTRKLVFVRMPAPADSGRGRWHLVGSSGVDVHTRGGATRIQSIRIQSASLDTLITDPLELHRLRHVMLFQPGAPVTLTVNTGNASDVVLFYGRDARRRFINNGDGTFRFEFPAGQFPGLRHLGVDALSNGTLFDDVAAYDSNAWMIAFAVDPMRAPIDRN